MITNRKLTLFIFLTGFILLFINYPITYSAGLSVAIHKDLISLILVGFNSILCLFLITNNIHYENEHYLKIRSQFLIEIFIISGILASLFGFFLMATSASISDGEITGDIIAKIGLSFGVAFVSLFYGFLFATSTYLITKLILSKNNQKNKIFNIQHSKKWVSLICLLLLIFFNSLVIWIGFSNVGLEFNSSNKLVYLINILILTLIFSIIINKNFKIILNSFLNKVQPIELLEQTLTAIYNFIKVISGLNTVIILSLILHLMFTLEGPQKWTITSTGTLLLLINFIFIFISKVIELRLRTDLIGQNHFHSKVDKYFLLKYILPVLMVYMIILIFQFIITFFI